MDFGTRLDILFEKAEPQWLLLQKPESVDEEELGKILSTKPGEINIILAEVVKFLKGDLEGKTKRMVIVEILDVLSRSFIARKFVSLGLNDTYKLFKGFAVRRGDPYDFMPEPDSELKLQPKDKILNWTTDATSARESGATFDATQGDPIGGLMVKIDLDDGKIYFDINAVIRAVRNNIEGIRRYNESAASGMAISKANTDYLANDTQFYTGEYEVVSPSSYNSVLVIDKWEWAGEGDSKRVKWVASDKKSEKKEIQKESYMNDSAVKLDETILTKYDSLDEGFMDFMGKAFGTMRGNSLLYMESMIKELELKKSIFEDAILFTKLVDVDDKRTKMAQGQLKDIVGKIVRFKSTYEKIKSGAGELKLADLGATPQK